MEAGHVLCIHQLPVILQRRFGSELIEKGDEMYGVSFFMEAMP